MGITGLLPFIEKASRRTNISEFNGSTVAIDTYCWLHKGAFSCAEKLVRGEDTDAHIKYCLKYVTMLLSKNIKPILVFDGRHLPAKAITEAKRRESRQTSKKRAAELLSLGRIEEARSFMRRSVDITHEMALCLIKECRRRNVDCIVAPYEADAQLAYLNIRNIAQLVITEDSDLIPFGCTKVLFKMDLEGNGSLVETIKLPLAMKCPIEQYSFDKFRQMCIMSGCDYISSLPGIGLTKARQFIVATQDPNIGNALKKLPSFFSRSNLVVTQEYRENFLKAEATFKHQYVYDPLIRKMVRLNEVDDEDIEQVLCVNAGEVLETHVAFQLALGNLDPFTLKKLDDWHPDHHSIHAQNAHVKSNSWNETNISKYPSIWGPDYVQYLDDPCPWRKKVKKLEPIITKPKSRKVVNLVTKYVPETQDESLSIETLSDMYCVEPTNKRAKIDDTPSSQSEHNLAIIEDKGTNYNKQLSIKDKSPILENKERSFKKCLRNGSHSILKRLSRFPRTIMDDNIVESKFFSTENNRISTVNGQINLQECIVNTFKPNSSVIEIKNENIELELDNSQKENPPCNSPAESSVSPVLSPKTRNPFKRNNVNEFDHSLSEDSVIDNTYPMETLVTPVNSQESFSQSPPKSSFWSSQPLSSQTNQKNGQIKSNCRVPGLRKKVSLPTNQPTLLSKFGFQKKSILKPR